MDDKKYIFKFIGISSIGILIFLLPFTFYEETLVLIEHLVVFITHNFLDTFIFITHWLALIVTIFSFIFIFYTSKNKTLNILFKTDLINSIFRVLGSFIYLIMINSWFSNFYPFNLILDAQIVDHIIGQHGILTTITITFSFTILLLPLLTNFGIIEYFGVIFSNLSMKLFNKAGYSFINLFISFVGEGTMGIILINSQYKAGYYSRRDAFLICSTFSIIGLSLSYSIANHLHLAHVFNYFYFTILFIYFILALIINKMPFKKFNNDLIENPSTSVAIRPDGMTTHSYALFLAGNKARESSIKNSLKNSLLEVIHTFISLLPIITLFSSLSLVIVKFTHFFKYLSKPLTPIFSFMFGSYEIGELVAISTLLGFLDLHLPSLFISHYPVEYVRFFVGVISFSQMIYFAETGIVLLKSSIGISFFDLIKIFMLRTVLAMPIAYFFTMVFLKLNILT